MDLKKATKKFLWLTLLYLEVVPLLKKQLRMQDVIFRYHLLREGQMRLLK